MTATVRPHHRPRVLLAMDPELEPRLFTPAQRARLARVAEVHPAVVGDWGQPGALAALADADALLTFWGAPRLDTAVLDAAPKLRAVAHAAGSVKGFLPPEVFDRGIVVSSATEANARPVAEFTLAMIILAGKNAFTIRERYRAERRREIWQHEYADAGNYDRVVGIIGASRTGRQVIRLLKEYAFQVVVYDPYLSAAAAAELGVAKVELPELCAAAHIVSVHAPALPETRHMIDADCLALMRDGATFINTARGSLVDTAALTAELVSGRINAIVDVTDPEILPADSPLYELPNVMLTPHIAGSLGRELRRMAASAIGELERFAAGEPFRFPVLPDEYDRTA